MLRKLSKRLETSCLPETCTATIPGILWPMATHRQRCERDTREGVIDNIAGRGASERKRSCKQEKEWDCKSGMERTGKSTHNGVEGKRMRQAKDGDTAEEVTRRLKGRRNETRQGRLQRLQAGTKTKAGSR